MRVYNGQQMAWCRFVHVTRIDSPIVRMNHKQIVYWIKLCETAAANTVALRHTRLCALSESTSGGQNTPLCAR